MPKFCSNGHQMEESWEICPYCPKPGFVTGAEPKRTVLEEEPRENILQKKTKVYTEVEKPRTRETLVMSGEKAPPAATDRRPLVGWLVALSGKQEGEDFKIRGSQTIIGSASDCDIVIDDPYISLRHASLRYQEGKFYLTDLDSTNGTFVNDGKQSITKVELKDSDVIRIGQVKLKFKSL